MGHQKKLKFYVVWEYEPLHHRSAINLAFDNEPDALFHAKFQVNRCIGLQSLLRGEKPQI